MKEDLKEALESLEQGEYGIGIHGIDKGSSEEKHSTALDISKNGLNITNNSKTILSTAISLGTNEETERLAASIGGYKFGSGPKFDVVIAVPLCIQNENGDKIFLGFPEENMVTSGQQYEEHCISDRVCAKLKKVPPEFILGYCYENQDGEESFVKNEGHYSSITSEQKENLFHEISEGMDDISKSINGLILEGDIERLSQMKQMMQERDIQTYMIDNAMILAQKYPKRTNTHKFLLDSYQDVKPSDLTHAKQNLREGSKTQEKNYEGKEV